MYEQHKNNEKGSGAKGLSLKDLIGNLYRKSDNTKTGDRISDIDRFVTASFHIRDSIERPPQMGSQADVSPYESDRSSRLRRVGVKLFDWDYTASTSIPRHTPTISSPNSDNKVGKRTLSTLSRKYMEQDGRRRSNVGRGVKLASLSKIQSDNRIRDQRGSPATYNPPDTIGDIPTKRTHLSCQFGLGISPLFAGKLCKVKDGPEPSLWHMPFEDN